jgi:ligand-binding sensor domain-containing protein/DNA-binding CsgD family transcriptional regulator
MPVAPFSLLAGRVVSLLFVAGIWVILLGVSLSVQAATGSGVQSRSGIFTAVGATNGLNARVVPSMMIDQNGFLWVGSREGLFRYDGYEALEFLPEADNPGSISDIDVRCVYEDNTGNLWAGTFTGGLNRYDAGTGTFEHYRHDPADPGSINDDSIVGISDGPEGGLWVASEHSLNRLDRSSGKFQRFRFNSGEPGSLAGNEVTSLHLGTSGRFWIGTISGGLNLWNPASRSFSSFNLAELAGGAIELNDIFSLHEDGKGILWIGTRVGLVVFDPDTQTAREILLDGDNLFDPGINSMAVDQEGRLWLGTLIHGVLVVDMRSEKWVSSNNNRFEPDFNLLNQPQMSMAISQDMLFVGTWGGGVFRTSVHSTSFDLLRRENSEGLRNENISAVMAGNEQGRPWLGTHGGGPQRAEIISRTAEQHTGFSENLQNAIVLHLAQTRDGDYLAGTGEGLYTFDDSGLQVGYLTHELTNPDSIGEGTVRFVLPSKENGLWIGTGGNGLYLLDRQSGTLTNYRHDAGIPDSISGNSITALLEEEDGTLWVATRSNGLNRCHVENWSCERFPGQEESGTGLGHSHVTSLFLDRQGAIWVGTGEGGLNRVMQDSNDRVTGFRQWRTADGLIDDTVMSIQQDTDDSLWLSTRQGLSRFDPGTGRIINYVAESGLPVTQFNTNSSAADNRYIYFGSVRGLLSIPKGSGFPDRQPAKVRISSIERAAPGAEERPAYVAGNTLSVPHEEVLSIKLAVLDLSESPHEYEYRLQAEDPWQNMGVERHLILHGLAPGRYHFQARGRDVFGFWGESDTLILDIVPPFWMTQWFRVLVVTLLLLMAYGIHVLRQAALKRRSREIQRLSEKREQALEEQLGSGAELSALTPRQKEILQLIAEGRSSREIAGLLGVSIKTVEAHRANLMDRLDIHDVPGLVRLAIRTRLISPFD